MIRAFPLHVFLYSTLPVIDLYHVLLEFLAFNMIWKEAFSFRHFFEVTSSSFIFSFSVGLNVTPFPPLGQLLFYLLSSPSSV